MFYKISRENKCILLKDTLIQWKYSKLILSYEHLKKKRLKTITIHDVLMEIQRNT